MARAAAAPAPPPPSQVPSPTASSVPGPATGVIDPAVSGPLADDLVAQQRAEKEARKAAADKASDDKDTRKATILANLDKAHQKQKLAVALGDAAPKVDKPLDPPKPKEPAKPIEQVAAENAEIRRLKAELAKYADKKPGESKADFIEALKKDPGEIFKAIDDPELLVKLAEARQKHLSTQDPALLELKAEQESIKQQLADAKAEKERLEYDAREKEIHEVTEKAILEGIPGEDGKNLLDVSGYPIVKALVKAGDVDVTGRVVSDSKALIRDLGREPTPEEMGTILSIVLDKLEAKQRRTVEVARGLEAEASPAKPPKTETTTRPQDRRPTTLTPRMVGGGNVPVIPSNRTKADRKNAVYQRLATAKLQERMGTRQ